MTCDLFVAFSHSRGTDEDTNTKTRAECPPAGTTPGLCRLVGFGTKPKENALFASSGLVLSI